MADPFAKYAEQPQDDPFAKYAEEPKPESGITGWVKGKLSESEARRQETLKHPVRSVLTGIANTPVNPMSVGSMVRAGREFAGNQTPYSVESYLPDPTAGSVAKGIADLPIKVAQIGQHGYDWATGGTGQNLASDSAANYVDSIYKDPTVVQSNVGEMIGQSLLPMGVSAKFAGAPQVVQKGSALAEQVRKALAVVKGGTAGAAIGATATPEIGVTSNEDFAGRLPKELATGFGFGAGLSALAQYGPGIMDAGGQLWRRFLGTPAERQALLAKAQEMRDATASAQYPKGAEPTLGEVMQSPGVKRAENMAEYIPGSGRGAQLQGQNAAINAKVNEVASGGLASKMAPEVVGPEISASASRELANKRAPAVALYDEVRSSVGTAKPTVSNTVSAYDRAIKTETGISGPNSPAVRALEMERDNLAQGVTGQTYSDLEKIQDRLQSHASTGSQSADQVARDIAAYKAKISKAVSKDLRATADTVDPTGQLGDKYAQANKIYSDTFRFDPSAAADSSSTKARTATRILHGQEGFQGKTAESLLKGDDLDMAKHAFDALDAQGRDAVKSAIMERIVKATNPPKGQIPSPKQGANAILDQKNFIEQFFGPTGRLELEGLQKAMAEMQRSGQYMETIATGKFVPAMAGVGQIGAGVQGLLAGHPGAIPAAALPSVAARIFSQISGTQAGKDWLLKVSSAPANSRMMSNLMADLPKIAALQSGAKNVTPLQPAPSLKVAEKPE